MGVSSRTFRAQKKFLFPLGPPPLYISAEEGMEIDGGDDVG